LQANLEVPKEGAATSARIQGIEDFRSRGEQYTHTERPGTKLSMLGAQRGGIGTNVRLENFYFVLLGERAPKPHRSSDRTRDIQANMRKVEAAGLLHGEVSEGQTPR
jgi:hypothetical protein